MKTSDFSFELPEELIAQKPTQDRGESRLLVLHRDTEELIDSAVRHIQDFIPPNSLMIFNNSKVRKARIYGTSDTGGSVEFLLLSSEDGYSWRCMVKKAKKQRVGKRFSFEGGKTAVITGEDGEYRILRFDTAADDAYLDAYGHIPLPPYIKREDTADDASRYQTVYADPIGSAAAPTAGLHFTPQILEKLRSKGIRTEYVTLHVGLGTFAPIRTEQIEDHKMHTEEYEISPPVADAVNAAKMEGRPVFAVGTTSLRTLESAADENGVVRSGKRSTNLFVYPGFEFRVVDGLFTNFHTPDSSLILLVSAFGTTGLIKRAYAHAIENRYRFFSYGDAMLILP